MAQTSPAPLALEIVKADCCTLFDASGREYMDLIGGISVANTGHRHPKVISAIQTQLDAYLQTKVPEITQKYKGTPQYPASYSYGNDFPIIIIK